MHIVQSTLYSVQCTIAHATEQDRCTDQLFNKEQGGPGGVIVSLVTRKNAIENAREKNAMTSKL